MRRLAWTFAARIGDKYQIRLMRPKSFNHHVLTQCLAQNVQYEPQHVKTNTMACAPSEDSDQSGHPPSLIRVFVLHSKDSRGPKASLNVQRRLWSDWVGCPGWSESSLGAHAILLVLSWGGSYIQDLPKWYVYSASTYLKLWMFLFLKIVTFNWATSREILSSGFPTR